MQSLKFLSILLLVSFEGVFSNIVFGDEQLRLLQRSFEDCHQTSNVDLGILNNARNNQFIQDAQLMAYYDCMFRHGHLNFITPDGMIMRDNIRKFFNLEGNQEMWNDIIAHCFKMEGSGDIRMMIYATVSCFTDRVGGRLNL